LIKKILFILIVLVLAIVFWFGFALWTGIYSIYSYPPSYEHPEGSTLIISRESGEPAYNSPNYKPAPKAEQPRSGGIVFSAPMKSKRPVETRIIVELPYIEWAYKKSLEPQTTD
jgi:hypothetical protein